MKILVFLTFLLSLNLILGQQKLPQFYKSRITTNKDFYIGISWQNDESKTSKPVRYQIDNWSFYRMNSSELEELYNHNYIKQIYLPVDHAKLMNDTVRVRVGVDKIHSGMEPIPQSFEGQDIVYGYVDSGIDYNHADFMNADSSTRVLYYWDQGQPFDIISTPGKYGYGQVCDSASINAGTCTLNDSQTHGSTVAGSGSGNGLANGLNKGMAPKTDIIMVQTDFSALNWDITVADAIDFIFSMADTLGKPCIINTSVGNYLGSHDGLDPAGHIVDSLINDKPGRLIVASAGNSGNLGRYHIKHYSSLTDTSFFWVNNNPSSAFGLDAVYFDMWADTADFSSLKFSISADKTIGGFERRAESPYWSVSDLLGAVFYDTLISFGGDTICHMELYAEEINGLLHFELFIPEPDSNSYYFGFNVTGAGSFDAWTAQWMGLSDFINTGLPIPSDYPKIVNYIYPDSLSTIVSSWTCLESVVTVANLVVRDSYIDADGNLQTLAINPGALSPGSSRGPSRIGLVKPEIGAPGDVSLSTVALAYRTALIGAGQTDKLGAGGWHVRNGGTSMASPVVGGVGALYLERCALGNWQDFKSKLIASAKTDAFTGTTPNNEWGYGKLDGFALLSLSGPNIEILGDTGICDGNPALLSLNQFYDSISWNTGESSLSILVNTEQYITAYAEDNLKCFDYTDSVFIRVGTTPLIPTINEVGGGLLSSSGAFYQWYLEGVEISGETNQLIFPTINGYYTVKVMDSAGCHATSSPFLVGFASLDENELADFNIYPNPSHFELNITGSFEIKTVELFSIEGKLIFSKTLAPNTEHVSFRITDYEKGIYLLRINNNSTHRIVFD